MVNKIIIALSMGLTAGALAQDFCNTAKHTGASKKVNGNEVSSYNGVGYELWYDRATSGSLTIYEDGSRVLETTFAVRDFRSIATRSMTNLAAICLRNSSS